MNAMTKWVAAAAAALAMLAFGVDGAPATPRVWLLQDVVFTDGRIAIGSFGYDDATNTVTTWNIRVDGAPGILPFTYVPGDSTPWGGVIAAGLPQEHFRFVFYANVGSGGAEREIRLSVASEPDGTPSTLALLTFDPVDHGYYSAECCSIPSRGIASGSLVLVPFPPPVGLVEVIEFYHAGFGHYFMSANPAEINALDTGYFTGWTRTGYSFKAYATGSSAGPTMNPVCRYYGLPSAGIDSHFYSASPVECWQVNQLFGTEWQIESDNVFQIDLPNAVTGACPGGTIPVYRVFNDHHDANHRYTTSTTIRAQMEALGWIREGYGPDATIMCAIP
jgi:hypothetical protein